MLPTLTLAQLLVMTVGIVGVVLVLFFFKSKTFSTLKGPAFWLVQFMGRRSMEIYVLHFLTFFLIQQIFILGQLKVFGFNLF